ncbi:bacteriophage abortive infection AbiH family protein [Rahnella aceris]
MKLYIIGNGFDMYHNLETSYISFGKFLKEKHNDVYSLLLEYFGFEELKPCLCRNKDYILWSEFEHSLSLLDAETVLETHRDSLPNISSDDFRDRDRYTFQVNMEIILETLTEKLLMGFKEFIQSVKYPAIEQNEKIRIDKNSTFLNFNYTNTLTNYYDIVSENILFIHNKADSDNQSLILGHGINPLNFATQEETQPKNLSEEELEQWTQYMADKFDYSFELGKDMIMQYFSKTFKGTAEIIKKNEFFFKNLISIDEVVVLGHSFSSVDMPYFEVIAKSVKPDAKWTATYYSNKELTTHSKALEALGVNNFNLVKMSDI